jgi:hypothetical protein
MLADVDLRWLAVVTNTDPPKPLPPTLTSTGHLPTLLCDVNAVRICCFMAPCILVLLRCPSTVPDDSFLYCCWQSRL